MGSTYNKQFNKLTPGLNSSTISGYNINKFIQFNSFLVPLEIRFFLFIPSVQTSRIFLDKSLFI